MVQLSFARTEIKYRLTNAQRARLECVMATYMEGDAWGPSTIMNVYYDTPSYLLTRRSLEGPAYKEKVRTRQYGLEARPAAPVFLELKKKCGGVVYKRRATLSRERATAFLAGHGDPRTQIERELDFTCRRYGGLVPEALVVYDREAFYDPVDHDFRMTFDRNVRSNFARPSLDHGDEGTFAVTDADTNILEVKVARGVPLWLDQFLVDEGIVKVSFSKIGAAYTQALCAGYISIGSPVRGVAREVRSVGVGEANVAYARRGMAHA